MYEVNPIATTSALRANGPLTFTDTTLSRILALSLVDNNTVAFDTARPDATGRLTVAAGAEVVLVESSHNTQTTLTPPSNAPVLVFQGQGGVNVVINDGATTVPASAAGIADRVVIGSAGNDHIVVSDGKNTQISLGTGNSTVLTGSGEDTVVAGLGNSTIVGGSGHSIVQMSGHASDYQVKAGTDGTATITHQNGNGEQISTKVDNIQYVQLDNGEALILADNKEQAVVSALYHALFGRTADAGGLDYWFDKSDAGVTLSQIAAGFISSTEYQAQGQKSDAGFVTDLYLHVFGRAPESDGLAYWTNELATGASRAAIASGFAQIAIDQLGNGIHMEATVIGSVTILHNIV